jgi:hypothetical protein
MVPTASAGAAWDPGSRWHLPALVASRGTTIAGVTAPRDGRAGQLRRALQDPNRRRDQRAREQMSGPCAQRSRAHRAVSGARRPTDRLAASHPSAKPRPPLTAAAVATRARRAVSVHRGETARRPMNDQRGEIARRPSNGHRAKIARPSRNGRGAKIARPSRNGRRAGIDPPSRNGRRAGIDPASRSIRLGATDRRSTSGPLASPGSGRATVASDRPSRLARLKQPARRARTARGARTARRASSAPGGQHRTAGRPAATNASCPPRPDPPGPTTGPGSSETAHGPTAHRGASVGSASQSNDQAAVAPRNRPRIDRDGRPAPLDQVRRRPARTSCTAAIQFLKRLGLDGPEGS